MGQEIDRMKYLVIPDSQGAIENESVVSKGLSSQCKKIATGQSWRMWNFNTNIKCII